MKHLGMAILIGGIALCASFGARLSPELQVELSAAGAAKLAGQAERGAFKAWCAAAKGTPAAAADGCPGEAPAEGQPAPASPATPATSATSAAPAPPTEAERIAAGQARLAALQAQTPAVSGEAAAAHAAWLAAVEAQIAPAARAASTPPTPPGQRVRGWFGESGLPFLAGLFLVTLGAILARRGVRAEALRDRPASEGGPVDFGVLLDGLRADARALVDRMASAGRDLEGAKAAIETMQLEQFTPLIEARGRLQARYGLAGYAEVFGPFSGAERRLNRAWSALVDGHWPEAVDSVKQAAEGLDEAAAALARIVARAG